MTPAKAVGLVGLTLFLLSGLMCTFAFEASAYLVGEQQMRAYLMIGGSFFGMLVAIVAIVYGFRETYRNG